MKTNHLPDTSENLPAHGQDIFNYLAGAYASNHQLNLVLTFNTHLQENLLARAVRITLDLAPILSCRFVEHPVSSYFKHRDDLSTLDLCSICETETPEEKLREYIALELDSQYDPMVQVIILRSPEHDVLCIKMDHTASDAGGLKEYAYLLAEVYSQLLCTTPSDTITPVNRERDCSQIFKHFGIDNPLQAWDPSQLPPPQYPWAFPSIDHHNRHPAFITNRLSAKQFLSLQAYAKSYGATINDILLTAFYRALFKLTRTLEGEPRPISVSVDLRRHLPKNSTHVIANLSSSFTTLISSMNKESFSSTLTRVAQSTTELKQTNAVIPLAIFFELLGNWKFTEAQAWFNAVRRLTIDANSSTPIFSNIGVINPVSFGEHTATAGYVVTPAIFAPGFMLGASTYKQELTLVANVFTSDIALTFVQEFLSSMMTDLKTVILT